MKPLRALEISLRADRSGGPRHLLTLLRLFPDDLEVFVCAPPNEELSPEFERESAGLLPCPRRRFSLPVLLRLAREIRTREIDLIHSHGRGAGLYSRLLGLITGRPVVHTFHGVHLAAGPVGLVKDWMDRILRAAADAYILVSQDEFKAAETRGWLSTRALRQVIPNGVDIPPTALRRPAPAAEPVIGQIARKDPVKGWDLLNRLLVRLRERTTFKLLVAGLSPQDFQPEPALISCAKTLGVIPEPRRLFEEIDLYLSTSRNEGLPLAVLEAMACGIPCLLSEVPGHTGLIGAGAARGYRLDDEAGFFRAAEDLLSNPAERARLGDAGRTHVRQHHAAETMTQLTVDLYRRLLPPHRGGAKQQDL